MAGHSVTRGCIVVLTQPLRICIVTSQYPPQIGGLGHSTHRIATMLAKHGVATHVVVFTKHHRPVSFDDSLETSREGEITVHRAKVWHPDWREVSEANAEAVSEAAVLTRYNRELFDLLNHLQLRYQFDLLHAFFLYPAGFAATTLARYHQIRSIVSIRGNDVGKYMFDPLRREFVRTALAQADYVTSVAASLHEIADKTLAPLANRSRVILNSIDLASATPNTRPDLPLRGTVIGAAGLFRYKKGLIYLFKALARLKNELDFTLLLAGDFFSPADREKHLADLDALGLREQMVLTGRVPHGKMPDYLQLFDVVVFPSLFAEGCPLTMLEAMAVGIPVIASRTGAIPEVIKNGESGLLVEPGSSDEIYAAIKRVLSDSTLRADLAAGARNQAEALSPARERREWLEVYEKVLGISLGERLGSEIQRTLQQE